MLGQAECNNHPRYIKAPEKLAVIHTSIVPEGTLYLYPYSALTG